MDDQTTAFFVLGSLEVVREGERVRLGSTQQRRLLAVLLAHANEVVSSDRLADSLWGESSSSPQTLVSRLQTLVSRLRTTLGDDRLETRPPGYRLQVANAEVDVLRFAELAELGLAASDRPIDALRAFDEALGLWRGSPYEEFASEEFAAAEVARLVELHACVIEERSAALLELDRPDEVIAELESEIAVQPFRERLRGLLMLALARTGRPVESLRAYDAFRRFLADEIGVVPSTKLQELNDDIVRQHPDVAWAGSPAKEAATADLPSGTVTFLFTDLVGSTPLWDEHPEAMQDALASHDATLRTAVERHGGQIVKMTGDGVHAVFTTAPQAVAMATDALREMDAYVWGATGPLAIRIGIHTGTAQLRDGDYHGSAVNRANRIMAAAHGGQAVLSQASAALVRDTLTDEITLADLGEHRLRGLSRAEHVYQLEVPGLRSQFPPLQTVEAFPSSVSLPFTAFAHDDQELAGRDAELEELERAWAKSRDGARQVALVAGEPGIGKTRLVGELSRRAHVDGAVVLYGRCDEESIVPYQPFVEALRPYVAACPPSTLRERLHGLEVDLARVFPDLVGRLPELAVRVPSEPESAGVADSESERLTVRYHLFEAFATLLTGITAAQPLLLVLDDVHWADHPTLLLLRHLLRSTPNAPVLIVACYRDVELVKGQPLAELLGDLRREQPVTWVALHGLSEPASAHLVRGVAGHEVSSPLTRALHRETGGNPFFLEEVVRHLIETGALPLDDDARPVDLDALDLPQGVRDVITRRIRRLPGVAHDVLDVAAVVGPEFDAALLGQVAERAPDEVLDALDDATDAGLVTQLAERIGGYSFAHELIRQALYTELKTAQRARLHARVGTALEESASEHSAALLAQHFRQAMPLVDASKVIEYTTRAGHDALADLAFEDAASHFERALALLEQDRPIDATQRVELMIDWADALGFVDQRAGVEAAMRAVDAARANDSAWQLGRAVSALAEPNYAVTAYPAEVTRLFDEAQAALGDEHPALRARLLAQEAFKYASYQLEGRDGRALARSAVGLARETNDPLTLADALFALATSLEGVPDIAERAALGEELIVLGRSAGARPWTYGLRVIAATDLELGNGDALESTIGELHRVGVEMRWLPALAAAAQWRATHALLQGRFDDIAACWEEMRGYRRVYGGVGGMQTVQGYFLAREQGELDRAFPLARMAEQTTGNLYAHAMFAIAQLESGEEAAAVRRLDVLESDDFRVRAMEGAWMAVVALLAEVAATGGTPEHAAVLCESLTPFAGHLLTADFGLACLGAADRYLGMMSTMLGRWEDADAQFERAVALESRLGGAALVPRTRYWQARSLRARGDEGNDVLDDVIAETTRLGMPRLRAQAEALRGA